MTISESPYQFWQTNLLYYSFIKNSRAGAFLALVARSPNSQYDLTRELNCPYQICRPYSPHPVTGEDYSPYNKPGLLKQWLDTNPPAEFVQVLDPDCLITSDHTEKPEKGSPLAQSIWYMEPATSAGKVVVERHAKGLNVQPISIPILIHRDELHQLVGPWLKYTEILRQDPISRKAVNWVAEMWGYSLAAAHLKLTHRMKPLHSLSNDEGILPVIHYTYEIISKKGVRVWDKREHDSTKEVKYPDDIKPSGKYVLDIWNEFRRT